MYLPCYLTPNQTLVLWQVHVRLRTVVMYTDHNRDGFRCYLDTVFVLETAFDQTAVRNIVN